MVDAQPLVEVRVEVAHDAAEAGGAVLQRLIEKDGVGVVDAKRAAFGGADLGGDDIGIAGGLLEEDEAAGIGAETDDLFAEVAVELARFFIEAERHILVFDSVHHLFDVFDVFVFGFAVQVELADDQAERVDAGVGHGVELFNLVFPFVADVAGGDDHEVALVLRDEFREADAFYHREHFGFRRSTQRENTGTAELFVPAQQALNGRVVDRTVSRKRRDHCGISTSG